ncbi:hypothetical protein [Alteromonas sp. 14N.309.X.WAT.G.H12]|uniref:hypothetical protein n=1 Tax=Alteromonas sp. 14N.309.X.WAT.G.H12 TaxID=3120824 RepID=UPI002FCEA9FB
MMPQKITEESVKKFIVEVKNATPSMIARGDRDILNSIPPQIFEKILQNVYSGDVALARNIMSNRFDQVDYESPEEEIRAIRTLIPASETLYQALQSGSSVLLISDTDNDGSLAQGIMIDARKYFNPGQIHVASKSYSPFHHGFELGQIDGWLKEQGLMSSDEFTVIVADLGTNQGAEQKDFILRYPNANLIVADHHKPDFSAMMKFEAGLMDFLESDRRPGEPGVGFLTEGDVAQLSPLASQEELELLWLNAKSDKNEFVEALGQTVNMTKRSYLVSPFAKGSMSLGLRNGGGVSGGFLVYMLMSEVFKRRRTQDLTLSGLRDEEFNELLMPMKKMGRAANLLDEVDCDIRLKPLQKEDIDKALDLARITRSGRSLGKWIRPTQREKIQSLEGFVGLPAVQELLDIQELMAKENHTAAALISVLPKIFKTDGGDEGETKALDVRLEVVKFLQSVKVSETVGRDYVKELRPHFFNFNYENQVSSKSKHPWLAVAEETLMSISRAEKDILTIIRDHQLVSEISLDFAMLTQSISPEINDVFTAHQLKTAYHSLSKPVDMGLTYSRPGEVTLSMRSDGRISISDILFELRDELGFISPTYRGHGQVGGLTLKYNPLAITSEHDLLKTFVAFVNREAKKVIDAQPLVASFELTTTHLKVVKEVMEVMRVHLSRKVAPSMLMRLSPDTTFEDKETLRKMTVSELVKNREWVITSEYLDFGMTSSLMIPNQALKAVSNDGYRGALSLQLLPNGAFMANDIVTGDQLAPHNVPQLVSPLDLERERQTALYKEYFMNKPVPVKKFTRKEGIEALQFSFNSEKVFNTGEAIALSLMRTKKADSYIVVDVEADGAGNAPCFNIGMLIMTPVPNSGTVVENSPEEFEDKLKRNPEYVRNWHRGKSGEIIVNERMQASLLSLVISKDGSKPILISFKSKNLTNMDQDMLTEVGCSAKEAQDKILSVLDGAGKFIIQAHNLPYDNNIIRVNFPEVYGRMQDAIHLDSAPLAKNHQIAYMNLKVSKIGGYEFFNAEHTGYNLNTFLDEQENFDFPSIKGDALLKVRGDDLFITEMSSRITTKLDSDRADLVGQISQGLFKVQYPKYGIQKLLRMATIRDMIQNKPVKKLAYVDFESFGFPALPPKLWRHFQEHYAFDLTPSQNVAKFSVMPGVRELLDSSTPETLGGIPEGVLLAKVRECGEIYNPGRKLGVREKADIEAAKKRVTYTDLLKYNAESFVKKNPENAERYALAWAYELVLDHHELAVKNVPASFIRGVTGMIGIAPEVVKQIYQDVYDYKSFRGIKRCMVDEDHANIWLEGDCFQEYMVVAHMAAEKLRNPYMTPAICFRTGLNPQMNVLEQFSRQAVESSLKQFTREVAHVSMDSTDLVNASAKQLMNQFSADGISIANEEAGTARFKCRSNSRDMVNVQVLFPEYGTERFKLLSDDEKQRWKAEVEKAITALVLVNSMSKVNTSVKPKLLSIATSPDVIASMDAIQAFFGKSVPTERESAIKKVMKVVSQAILGDKLPLQLPINKHLDDSDIDALKAVISMALNNLKENQGYVPAVSEDTIFEGLQTARFEYQCFKELRNTGEIPFGIEMLGSKSLSTQLTATRKMLGKILRVHLDANSSLASGVLARKADPLKFILSSDFKNELIKFDLPSVGKLKLNNDRDVDLLLDVDPAPPKDPEPKTNHEKKRITIRG